MTMVFWEKYPILHLSASTGIKKTDGSQGWVGVKPVIDIRASCLDRTANDDDWGKSVLLAKAVVII
ncbi:hypothetical protein DPMN_044362 [Dreissena polymorpha]|uniref:Uncharacterized protein n=1 Tax=Dreissena polymorpha TaxID=45954 RepID=A0A9D4HYR9_DREPO|nr:hypothetical protein DPMN_044362 [Dreissena polymorpha]